MNPLEKAKGTSVERERFPIWKTIKLVQSKNRNELLAMLNTNFMKLDHEAKDILSKALNNNEQNKEINLVELSVRELGLKDGSTLREIYDRAQELGLELCPGEVGPALRLQYDDQPLGESLRIGMEPVIDSNGELIVFGVTHNETGLLLEGRNGRYDSAWGGNRRFVFAKK